ncbi:hypothetical protein M758_2G075200 [Ceratodon purpureus]|nr:hypothetical protein M758_2G075200 [Ceratodon purpureus]
MVEISSAAMEDSVGAFTWLTQAMSGVNTLRGVELDTRHVLLQHLHSVCLVVLWILAYAAKIVLALLPTLVPLPVLTEALQKISTLAEEYDNDSAAVRTDESSRNHLVMVSKSPIGRSLTQVLALMNDVPSSSNKYAFLQDLADRVIEENKVEGGKFSSVNQAALRRGFSRTINLLGQSLESRQQHGSFLGRMVRHLPSRAMLSTVSLPGPLAKIRSLIGNILLPFNLWMQRTNANEATHLTNLADTDMAEKFATELLWIAEKLLANEWMEDAIEQWSSAPSLAELSLYASPKVQKSLVRLSALLCKGLVGNTNIPQDVCLQLVILWLPLLCNATHGGDGPIFSSVEKVDLERQLERLVAALPETDQEQILSTWLQEYALSQSDWPNLQKCYDSWCSSMRKLEIETPKVME